MAEKGEVKYNGPISTRLEIRESRFEGDNLEIFLKAVGIAKNGIFDGAEMLIWEGWIPIGKSLTLTNINGKLGWAPTDPQIVDLIPKKDS